MTSDTVLTEGETEDKDNVLMAFAEARAAAPDDKTLLRLWTTRYPKYAGTLIAVDHARYAAGMTLSDAVEDGPSDSLEAKAAAALGREAIAALRAAVSAPKPILTSLLTAAAAQGLDAAHFAQALRLDRLLLGRLEQRLLDAATVPMSLVRQIAALLGRTPDDIAAYLRGGPRLAMQAQFRASRAPSLPFGAAGHSSFADALGASHSMSAEDRAYWQSEVDAGVLGG